MFMLMLWCVAAWCLINVFNTYIVLEQQILEQIVNF